MVDVFSSFGVYGGGALAGFAFGIVPFNPDLPLFAISAKLVDSPLQLPLLVVVTTVAHVLSKILTYYLGIGLMKIPKGRFGAVIVKAQARLDRWGKWPKVIVFVSSAVGLPPLYLVGFIASAMRVRIVPFIALVTIGRLIHFSFIVALPWVVF